jgi:hypothetical protein
MASRTPTPIEQSPSKSETAGTKRIRLSLACNQCRKRKVRCDTEKPKCRNCLLRNEVCETTDPRYRDGGPGVRRWATKDGLLPGQNPTATRLDQTESLTPHATLNTVAAAASLNRDRGVAPIDDSIPLRGHTSTSVSAVPNQSNVIPTSPAATTASTGGSSPQPITTWASQGHQKSFSVEGEGEVNIDHDSPELVVNRDDSNSHRVKVCLHLGPTYGVISEGSHEFRMPLVHGWQQSSMPFRLREHISAAQRTADNFVAVPKWNATC